MASVNIEVHDKKNGLYLIKADDLFLKETFSQIKPSYRPGESSTSFKLGNLDKDKTKINSINNSILGDNYLGALNINWGLSHAYTLGTNPFGYELQFQEPGAANSGGRQIPESLAGR